MEVATIAAMTEDFVHNTASSFALQCTFGSQPRKDMQSPEVLQLLVQAFARIRGLFVP